MGSVDLDTRVGPDCSVLSREKLSTHRTVVNSFKTPCSEREEPSLLFASGS